VGGQLGTPDPPLPAAGGAAARLGRGRDRRNSPHRARPRPLGKEAGLEGGEATEMEGSDENRQGAAGVEVYTGEPTEQPTDVRDSFEHFP